MEENNTPMEGAENTEVSQTSDVAPEQSMGESAAPEQTIDLDSVSKFKFAGREWTPKDFQGAYMLQADYTRKTTELAQERKYYDNLRADLEAVKSNPSLVAKFKSIYPDKFHGYLGYVAQTNPSQAQQLKQPGAQSNQLDQEVMTRLERMESDHRDRKIQAINAELDAKFQVLSGKYPMADEELVMSRAMNFLERKRQSSTLSEQDNVTITDKEWDDLWKTANDFSQKRAEKHYAGLVNKQTNANSKGKDAGSGGGIPGQAPNTPRTIKDATRAMRESEAFQNS